MTSWRSGWCDRRHVQSAGRSAAAADHRLRLGYNNMQSLSSPNQDAPDEFPNLGIILLAVWLIVFGLLTAPFLKVSFTYSGDLLALLAMAAGVCLFLQR